MDRSNEHSIRATPWASVLLLPPAMTTTNTNELLSVDSARAKDRDNTKSLSITRDPVISDPVFVHISETFTIRDLVRLKQVSNEIAELVSSNTIFTNKARLEDYTEDWYFPLLVLQKPISEEEVDFVTRKFEWTWSGVHHSPGRIHHLPCISHFAHPIDPYWLLASSGGLVLLRKKIDRSEEGWSTLVVSNPVTREGRVLPEPVDVTSWVGEPFLAFMSVDKRANTYKVILIFKRSMRVYKSTSKSWSFWILPRPIPLSIFDVENPLYKQVDVKHPCCRTPGVVVNGRVHFGELACGRTSRPRDEIGSRLNMLRFGGVRVYEVDDDAGVWNPVVDYPLGNYIPFDLHHKYEEYGFRMMSYMITIVECLGGMYAIILAEINVEEIREEIRQTYGLSLAQVRCGDLGILPLRFYILRLHGNGGWAFGRLLIHDASQVVDREIPLRNNISAPALFDFLADYILDRTCWTYSRRWYHSIGRGSVIWVTFANYVVEYNVVSGRSTTQILPCILLSSSEQHGSAGFRHNMAFEPSFCAKP